MRNIRCLIKRYTDSVESSDVKLALINGYPLSKCSPIVKLSIDTSFAAIGALRAEICILKGQIYIQLQTRGLAFWPLAARRINHLRP